MATSAPAPVVIGGKEYPAGTVVNQSTGHIMQPTGLLDDNQQPEYTDLTGSEYNRTHPGAGGVFGGFVDSVKGLPQGLQGLSPVLTPMAMMIPGLAPVLAGLNAAGSLANGKVNAGTILSALTAAGGMGNTFGFSPETIAGINTAKNVVGGVNALQTGNLAGLASSLNSFADVLPAGSVEATKILGGIASLKKGDTAGALSALASLTGSPDVKIASQAANLIKSVTPQSAQPTVGFGQTAKQPDQPTVGFGQTAPAAAPAATPAASNNGVAGLQSGQTLVHPLMAKTKTLKSIFGEDNPYEVNNPYEGEQMYTGGSVGLPSLLRS
jgi:hypothetical protein